MVLWPQAEEYVEAVQSPAATFVDARMHGARMETLASGLPSRATGQFAVVFPGLVAGERHAIRCIYKGGSDLAERYGAISRHFEAQNALAPYLVRFEFIERGIRIRGQEYPVILMKYAEGELLSTAVERFVSSGDSARLLRLADRWLEMLRTLKATRTGHGDLQHGNVLVRGEDLVLVDYDGMFVQALANQPPEEVGHPNYQHPGRTPQTWGERIDDFAGLVIWTSLLALAEQPSLWTRYYDAENLIFRVDDFRSPGRTPIWQDLSRLRSTQALDAFGRLRRSCEAPAEQAESCFSTAGTSTPGTATAPARTSGPTPSPGPPDSTFTLPNPFQAAGPVAVLSSPPPTAPGLGALAPVAPATGNGFSLPDPFRSLPTPASKAAAATPAPTQHAQIPTHHSVPTTAPRTPAGGGFSLPDPFARAQRGTPQAAPIGMPSLHRSAPASPVVGAAAPSAPDGTAGWNAVAPSLPAVAFAAGGALHGGVATQGWQVRAAFWAVGTDKTRSWNEHHLGRIALEVDLRFRAEDHGLSAVVVSESSTRVETMAGWKQLASFQGSLPDVYVLEATIRADTESSAKKAAACWIDQAGVCLTEQNAMANAEPDDSCLDPSGVGHLGTRLVLWDWQLHRI